MHITSSQHYVFLNLCTLIIFFKSIICEALRYEVFSSLLLVLALSCWAQFFSLAPCSQTSSSVVLAVKGKTRCDTSFYLPVKCSLHEAEIELSHKRLIAQNDMT